MSGTRIKQVAYALFAVALAAVALAACGGSGDSSQQAQTLLRESFKGRQVNSGILAVRLVVTPSGSKTLSGPLELTFGGPFEALGAGKPPKSNFTVRLSAFGRSGSLGVISTGRKGYVRLQGTAYRLPQATFRQFESSLGRVTNSGRSGRFGSFSKIDFVSWVRHPVVVGNGTVAGASTKHIHGGIDVRKMLTDLNTVIHKAPSLGASGTGNELS